MSVEHAGTPRKDLTTSHTANLQLVEVFAARNE